jgi:MSHA biogenesis protein MshP
MRRGASAATDGRAAGFALVPTLFLIVVVAALSAVALKVGIGQEQTVSMALQQARALAAARAGIDWGAYTALNGTCAGTTLNLTEGALAGFTVVVTCTATPYTDGSNNYQSYSISAAATLGSYGTSGFVQRVVRATFTNAT